VKNLEALIDAFTIVASNPTPGSGAVPRTSWRLVILGDGEAEYVGTLRARAGSSGCADRIVFAGWASGETKRAWLREASLFALASHHENFGVSLLEALALGVPAIVTPGVQLAAAVERAHAGWVSALDTGALASTLGSAMDDLAGRTTRAEAARVLARGYTWTAVASALVDLYTSLRPRPAAVRAPTAAGGRR
jgi:glycosyltransferase involved in cell wall biosynthesis